MSIKTALFIWFSLIGGYTSVYAQERIATNAMNGFSGFWVEDYETCKSGIPTAGWWIVGQWEWKKNDDPSRGVDPNTMIVWGKGRLSIQTDEEFGCMLRQPKRVGNELSTKTYCDYEEKRISSEVILSLWTDRTPNSMQIKIINKRAPTTVVVHRCGTPK